MKLQEFFNTQKNINCTDIDKLDVYQNILYKKTKKLSLKRASFVYTKYAVYMTISVIFLVGMYGMYIFNSGNFEDYNRFAIIKNQTNTVQADYIAQVIDIKWNFFIEHDGILTKTNNISNGDTILLKEDTQLVFEIDKGTQAKIIWPAKLIVQKTPNENYKLNLVYGDFIQMEGKEQKSQSIELAINDITIKQENKELPINFKFIKEGNNQIFQNNGANIIVSKHNGTNKSTTISKEQVMSIQNNDLKIFANVDSFSKAMQTKNVSQTFTLTEEETKDQKIKDQETISLLSLLNKTTTINENSEKVTQEITSVLGDEKKILDPEHDDKINNNLYVDFYTPELKELEKAYKEGNLATFNSVYTKIEKRIQNVYLSLNQSYTKNNKEAKEKLQNLISNIKHIQNILTTEYTVPPTYNENLKIIENTINDYIQKDFGSEKPQENEKIEKIEKPNAEKIQK